MFQGAAVLHFDTLRRFCFAFAGYKENQWMSTRCRFSECSMDKALRWDAPTEMRALWMYTQQPIEKPPETCYNKYNFDRFTWNWEADSNGNREKIIIQNTISTVISEI